MRHRAVGLAAALVLAAALSGCSDDPTDSFMPTAPASPTATASPTVAGGIVVFAAASLTEVFADLGKRFEAANPGVKVTFQFGSSATLAAQITQGAPADVFAAASPATMNTVLDAGDASGQAQVFARNALEIVFPKDNPGQVTGLADFTKKDLTILLCASAAPCGAAADQVFAAAGLTPEVDSRESDVRAVLTKIELGEADAALVYRTDVRSAADSVAGIAFPEAAQAVNEYPIVVLEGSGNGSAAAAWVDFVLSEQAQAALVEAGFDGRG